MLKLVGAGGMGVVYQALDRDLGVEVALKVLRSPPTSARTLPAVAELQRRFKTELLLARQITHKHVIRIHDIGEIGGIRFISMPYVTGGDLAAVLKRGTLPVAAAVRYARQLAAGLMAVHAAGVIHRDLKPANIMIGDNDSVLLMDFGIARSNTAAAAKRTMAGAIVGTAAYMAPEQARGETVDPRSDIYAFGLILYEMLGGPRTASMGDLLARMKAPPAPVRTINPRVPPAVDAIVTRCLQPDPTARYQSAMELAAAFAGLSRRGRGQGSAGTDSWRRWLSRAAAAALILALVGGAYLTVRSGVLATAASPLLALGRGVAREAERVVRADAPVVAEPPRRQAFDAAVPDVAPTGIPRAALLRAPSPPARSWTLGWFLRSDLMRPPDRTHGQPDSLLETCRAR